MFKRPPVLYVLIASVALALGLLVYLLDRRPEHVYFLSHGLVLAHGQHPLFGVVGNFLPTFVHVYAFILLTAAIAGSTRARVIGICAAWFVVASLFELAQLPAVASVIVAAVPAWFARVPILDNTAAYFLNGTFDVRDLLSIALGTVAAYFTVALTRNGTDARSSSKLPHRAWRYSALGGITALGMLSIIGSGGGSSGGTTSAVGAGSQLYVSGNGSSTLLVYNDANTVSGSTAANRVVAGGLTSLNAPRGIAVDMPRNQIYIANTGGNSILVFNNARTVTGGGAPSRTISAGTLSGPTALFVDVANDRLYVANTGGNSVLVYNGASTLNGTPTPNRTLTGFSGPTGIYVDTTRNLLYVSNGSQVLVFNNADSINGNVTPDRNIPGLSSLGGIFVDVMADRLYVTNIGPDSVLVFDNASIANGTPPDRTLSGGVSMLNQPRDLFVDTGTDRLYVANTGDDSILVFNNASTVSGTTTAPDRILSLPATTGPWGVYVDVTPLVIGSTASLDGYARSDSFASATGSPATGDKQVNFVDVGWRQLYSFDIASIPDSYTIKSAILHLYQCDVVNTPYASLGNVIVDHVNYGTVFDTFGSAYDGATVAFDIGTLSTDDFRGYHSLDVTTSVQNDLAASPTRAASQYRLRFYPFDFLLNFTDEYAQFTDAEDSLCAGTTTNQPPQLAVTLKP